MTNRNRFLFSARCFVALPLCVLLAAGCSKPSDTSSGASSGSASSGASSDSPMKGGGGGPGQPGGPGGGMQGGGRGKPIAENASGAEIYQAKCNCHGPEGKGGRAPVLTSVASRSDADLTKIIHDGHDKMPAFASQLSDAQITKVVAYIKGLK